MKARERIWHYLYGEGTVVESRHRGLHLIAQFRDGIKRLVRGDDIRELSNSSVTPVLQSDVLPIEDLFRPEDSHSRSVIEALRLGIVPYGAVRDFIFGRDQETAVIRDWLAEADAGPLVIKSGYGSGKSHLMDYARLEGLDNGFAVAIVELDPKETPPYRPKLIYHRLLQSFRFRDESGKEHGFRDFLRRLTSSNHECEHLDYLHWVTSLVAQGYEDDKLWQWIEGQPGYYYFPHLHDHGTAANIYCHILSEIAWAAEHGLGLKGLLLILDEAENINEANTYQQAKGWHFIRGLMMVSGNDDRLKREPVTCSYAELQVGRYFGKHTNLVYSGLRKDLRYCLDSDAILKVAFAFTNNDVESWLNNWNIRNRSIELAQLPGSALETVFRHVCLIYEAAFKYHLSDELRNEALQAVIRTTANRANLTRSFIKGSVEVLDILRFNHGLRPDDIH